MTTATLENKTQSHPSSAPSARTRQQTPAVLPRHRFERQDDQLVFTAVLPGIGPDDLDIQIENERVTLKAQAPEPGFDGFRKVYGEFGRNRYEAGFKVPQQYDPASIEAKLEAGLLTLTLAPRETAKPIRIAIQGG